MIRTISGHGPEITYEFKRPAKKELQVKNLHLCPEYEENLHFDPESDPV